MKKIIFFIGAFLMTANIKANEPKFPEMGKINFTPPQVERWETPNGLVVYSQSDRTLPIVHLTAMIKTGKVYDPKEKIGLSELFMTMLRDGGTARYKAEDIDKKLEFLGASIEPSINYEEARLSLTCLKKDFDEVFDIFFDMLKEPAFEEKIFALKKEEALEIIRRRNDKSDREAAREALRMFFGKGHPYGWRAEKETVSAITIKDLKDYAGKYIKANNIIIAAAGDIDNAEFKKKITDKFSSLDKGQVIFPEIGEVSLPQSKKVYFIDKPVSQASVVILHEGVKRHDDREYPLAVLSEYMGGGIQSKLGREIRSNRGLAYSVYSYFSKRNKSGFIMTYLGTKPQSVYEGTSEILNQLNLASQGNTESEGVDAAKSQIINSFVFRFPTVFNIVEERASYEYYGYKKDYLDNYVKKIDSVTENEVKDAAKSFYKNDRALIFVIGDAKKFDKPVSELGQAQELKED